MSSPNPTGPECILSADEVIERITKVLQEQSGQILAHYFNEICGGDIRYLGDSMFDADDT